MIKLSNGVEISEDTVVSALKKAGISVEPKPKHIFQAGDVAYLGGYKELGCLRFIVKLNGKLHSLYRNGYCASGDVNQDYFERYNYRYAGRLEDFLKI